MRHLVATAAALVLLAPASASAGTISSEVDPGTCDGKTGCSPDVTVITYTAAAGERNAVDVRFSERALVLEDRGAAIAPAEPCRAEGDRAVRCTGLLRLEIQLGDGEDWAVVHGNATVDGGAGDDVLSATGGATLLGNAGDDVVDGSSESDSLGGGPGADVLRGHAGTDFLRDEDVVDGVDVPAADQFDGGSGNDQVSYQGRTRPVVLDLHDPAPDGAPGEGDLLSGIEGGSGGAGADVLVGTAGPNRLDGSGGADRIEAGDGDDVIYGDEGDDRMRAGGGDDAVYGGDGADVAALGSGEDFAYAQPGDRVAAGPGSDRVETGFANGTTSITCGGGVDRLLAGGVDQFGLFAHADCETVSFGGGWLFRPRPLMATVRSSIGSLRFPCGYGRDCDVRIRAYAARSAASPSLSPRRGAVLVASARYTVRGGQLRRRLPLSLSRRGRRMLRDRGRLVVRVLVGYGVDRAPGDNFDFTGFRMRLQRRS